MANKTNHKFGVIHGTPSQLLDASTIEEGKLYFLSGDAVGPVKQGIYGINPLATGEHKTLTMFATGAVADGSGYGLSQYNFDKNYRVKLEGIEANANNYSHPGIGTADTSKTLNASVGTYISGIKRDSSGHIVDISTSAIVANKLAKKLSFNGIDFDGSKDVSLLVKGDGQTIDVSTKDSSVVIKAKTGDISNNSNALTTGAQVASYVSTQLGNLSGALLYKGTVANATELNGKTKTSGHVWISSAKDWEYTDVNGIKYAIEVGDMFICNGTDWNIVSSEFDVSTYSNELQWGTDVSIAVVDGVTIKVKLPGNPNTDAKVKDASTTSKSFILGHSTQGTTAEAQTNSSCYMQGGKLFSNGKEVLTSATDTKCTSLSLSADNSVEDPSTKTSVNVLLNETINATGAGTSLSGALSAVSVPTQKAVNDAKAEAIAAATIYWETL